MAADERKDCELSSPGLARPLIGQLVATTGPQPIRGQHRDGEYQQRWRFLKQTELTVPLDRNLAVFCTILRDGKTADCGHGQPRPAAVGSLRLQSERVTPETVLGNVSCHNPPLCL